MFTVVYVRMISILSFIEREDVVQRFNLDLCLVWRALKEVYTSPLKKFQLRTRRVADPKSFITKSDLEYILFVDDERQKVLPYYDNSLQHYTGECIKSKSFDVLLFLRHAHMEISNLDFVPPSMVVWVYHWGSPQFTWVKGGR